MFPDGEPVADARLAERSFGIWEGRQRAAVRASAPWAFTAAGHLRLDVTPPCGEPFELVCARVRDVIATVARLPPREHVFAVTHGGVLKTARYLLGLSLEAASDGRERFLELATFDVRNEPPTPFRSSGNPVEVTDAGAPAGS
jgi:broad specificity phosphatase PhoE